MAEFLALTGAPLVSASLPDGQVAAFAMLSRVIAGAMPSSADVVTAHVKVIRQREQTTIFHARAMCEGTAILEAEVTSSVVRLPTRPQAPDLGKAAIGTAIPEQLFAWKDGRLRLLDSIQSEDPGRGRLVADFTFNPDHPFVDGHFPGAPLMMGVLQWAAMADAAWLAQCRFGRSSSTIRASGLVTRRDGAVVADIRDLMLTVVDGAPFIRETKRVIFREPVYLGDVLLVDVSLHPCE